ncbi:hypothetical protein [Mycobacterium sp. 155]|uniref:hypothetical protein n=1 Tax=Mycobacterium sp. 155 TaxID=1157943 RepID=UPI00039A7D17|nr:hypothetical protein [Mycobacterium sp. 155]
MAEVGAAQLVAFAERMDELSRRAQNVLQRYLDHAQQVQGGGILNGAGGDMNIKTSAEVHEAQLRIQTRFQQLNDLIRQNTQGYTARDEDNAHALAAIPGQLRFS